MTCCLSSSSPWLTRYPCAPFFRYNWYLGFILWGYWPETLYICTPRWNGCTKNQISVWSDSWLGHQGAKTENTKCYNSWTNGWIISKFLSLVPSKDTWHNTRVLIWPTFQGHRGQSWSGSVSKVRSVTTGAIDLKLCTYVPLGHLTTQTKFRSSLILGLATRGSKPKPKTDITPELIWLYHLQIVIIGHGYMT
jgi:hypothetical protein